MALSENEQLNHVLEKSKHILIALKKDPSADAVSGAVACALFLKQLNKHVDIVSDNFTLSHKLSFLHQADSIKDRMPHLQKFIINVDVSNMGLQELSYDVKDNLLQIFLTPKHGFFTHDHIRTAQTNFRYDLIITMDTPDLDSLGEMYTNNTDLFYKVPIMNIDASPANEHYGTYNVIDVTASSTCEIIANMLEQYNDALIEKEIATALLTGMIAATQSFKTKNVKPQALTLASKLVGIGADREFIIQHLYRTKTLSTLKLWGQALAHLQYSASLGLVFVSLTREDFTRTGATETELYDIVDELIMNSPEAKMVLITHESITGSDIHVILRCSNGYNAKTLLENFAAKGDRKESSCKVSGHTLTETEKLVIDDIRTKLIGSEN